ncbi:MAG: ABC transporter ATP-binding protein [Proteobacteria bacterium]|nr:ABC transporter ATP-binding protein [Pseudomonadota bacterium]
MISRARSWPERSIGCALAGPVVGSSPVTDERVIRLGEVNKSYGTGAAKTHVLRGVSFTVERGEFLALVGQSGSGKSTLLNIIGGLDRADSGRVEVLGRDYNRASDSELSQLRNGEIGFVFQSFNLLDHLTCLGNVTLPAMFGSHDNAAADRGMDSLRRVGMHDLAHRMPAELSGGQKQRVAIARALFARPSLLLCDEPTGNLDTTTGREVIEFFRQLNERDGVTLIIVTHEHRVSSVARRIISIRDGQLVDGDSASDSDGSSTSDRPGGRPLNSESRGDRAERPAQGREAS